VGVAEVEGHHRSTQDLEEVRAAQGQQQWVLCGWNCGRPQPKTIEPTLYIMLLSVSTIYRYIHCSALLLLFLQAQPPSNVGPPLLLLLLLSTLSSPPLLSAADSFTQLNDQNFSSSFFIAPPRASKETHPPCTLADGTCSGEYILETAETSAIRVS
jgi:hypothetical protein